MERKGLSRPGGPPLTHRPAGTQSPARLGR